MNEELKLPPSSMEAEDNVLACIIVGGEEVFSRVKAWIRSDEAFYHKDSRIVWQCIKAVVKDRNPIDEIVINEKCKDKFPDSKLGYYISGLRSEIPTTGKSETYAKIIWERHIQRETAKSARRLVKASYDNSEGLSEVLSEHSRLISELETLKPSRKTDIVEIVDKTKENVKTKNNIISFNNVHLDAPAGGMTRKELTVIGGRPGHGKTTLMVNIIRCLMDTGVKVMLFNREMSNIEMMKKIIVMESKKLSYRDVRRGNLVDESKEMFLDTANKVVDKYKNLTMYDDIRTLDDAMTEVSRNKPDVIIDDYIQLIHMPDILERRFQLERVMYEYKWICKKENCSAILLSQLNRAIETRQDPAPRMSDFAESGVIEQTAELALFIWYPYNFDDSQHSPYESRLISAKTRYGRIGQYVMGFNGNRCKYYLNPEKAQEDVAMESKEKETWIHEDF